MKVSLLIVSFFFISQSGICQVVPNKSMNGDITLKKRIVAVTLDNQGNYFIDSKKVDSTHFDSSLVTALKKLPPQIRLDSAVVVINSESSVSFGKVYHVMQLAKKNKARVVVNMKVD